MHWFVSCATFNDMIYGWPNGNKKLSNSAFTIRESLLEKFYQFAEKK